jgi:pimeloyl-ACP methyl ester carboxylesterase
VGSVRRVLTLIGLGLLAIIVLSLAVGFIYQRAATASAFRRYKPAGRMISVGSGRRLHLVCSGSGRGPTVILESGFGGWSIDWSTLQPDIARFARVCSYDRAGMGYSDRGPASATSRAGVARDLRWLLERAHVPGPYVLVGHSLGGIYAREFARRYPDDVVAMVFVDSTHEDIAKSVTKEEFKKATSQIRQLRYGRYAMPFGVQRLMKLPVSNGRELPPSVRTQADAIGYRSSSYFALYDSMKSLFAENESGTLTMKPIPDVPVVVIASEENLDDPEHGAVWTKLQQGFLELTSDGRYVEAKDSGHFVMVDKPRIVVDAIRDVVEAVASVR